MTRRHHAAALALACAPALACDPVGSPLEPRPISDSSSGVVLIYRGDGPVQGPGVLDAWRFYDANSLNGRVTPLLFEVEGDTLILVGVGTSRVSAASGVQQHPFAPIAGTDQLSPGTEYAVGFTTRSFEPSGPDEFTQTGINAGVIEFTGYNIFTDPWDYAIPASMHLGQVYGPGGVTLNSAGLAGRIYSAEFLIDCDNACPPDLAAPFGTLNFFDLAAYIALYNANDPAADLAAPFGALNFFDLAEYIALYNAGCP
jgi:hypothetical protein